MNEAHSRAIVFLLAAILYVLLFGAGAALTGLAWVAGIVAAVAVLAVLVYVARRVSSSLAAGAQWLLTKGLALPIQAPLNEWRSIQERRSQGEHVGAVAASFTLLWASSFVWLFLVMMIWGAAVDLSAWLEQPR